MTNSNKQYAVILLRVALGSILIAHGLLKLFVFTPAGTVGYFASLGLPAAAAYLTIAGEIIGGAAIVAGIKTRLAALLSLPILLGATWVHMGNGWVFNSEGGGWEFPLLLVVLAAVVALQTPSSLDAQSS
jgi:putative oxidoreductase